MGNIHCSLKQKTGGLYWQSSFLFMGISCWPQAPPLSQKKDSLSQLLPLHHSFFQKRSSLESVFEIAWKYLMLSTFHLIASQPNGGSSENCLTSFIPYNGNSPKWYDRPCVENDVIGEKGHKFMCEVEEESGKKKNL